MTRDPAPPDVHAIDARASAWMKRGFRLLDDAQPGAVAKALACFDRALDLRRRLPFHTDPALRYGLAACWLNRADALMRLTDEGRIAAALQAYDEALVVLAGLPLRDDTRFSRRLAIAHQNRGLALCARGGSAVAAAIAAFTEAIAILDHEHAAGIVDRPCLLAVVLMNLANALASQETVDSDASARDAARRAIALVEGLEMNDADAAEAGLKGRHVLCRTIARQLSLRTARGEPMPDDVHEATDLVDDGLGLVRHWERKGVARYRDVASELFRFGARVYERYQPHFLSEFIAEHIDPDRSSPAFVASADVRAAADEALLLLRRERP